MSRSILLYLPLALGASAATPAASNHHQQSIDLRAAIDSMVSMRIAADSFSGVVLLSGPNGTIYQRAAGKANLTTGAPITPDTKFQIASTTKLFTQIAIRQLEQQGKLSLADTLGKFLPGYHNSVARSKVTIAQLLNHRSGIGSFWNARYMETHARVRSVADYVDLFQDDSLLFSPGTSEAYSNGGYVLLGAIIEKVSGQSYHDYLRDHVFKPAGMRETIAYDRNAPAANAAEGYTFQSVGAINGDQRNAGTGRPPGNEARASNDAPVILRSPGEAGATQPQAHPGGMLKLIGPDGKELSQEQIREAMGQRRMAGQVRHSNREFQPGMSGPAGDHYSTAGDFVKLAYALTHHVLLDESRTNAVLGERYATGGDFRASGGGPGVNAEFSIFRTGEVLVVLSNYDPPAATAVAQFVRARLNDARSQAISHR